MATFQGKDYVEKQLQKLIQEQNEAGTTNGQFRGSEPFGVLVTKAMMNLQAGSAGLAAVPDATTLVKGKVELATTAEAESGTDSTKAVTPAGVAAAIAAQAASEEDFIIAPVGANPCRWYSTTDGTTVLGNSQTYHKIVPDCSDVFMSFLTAKGAAGNAGEASFDNAVEVVGEMALYGSDNSTELDRWDASVQGAKVMALPPDYLVDTDPHRITFEAGQYVRAVLAVNRSDSVGYSYGGSPGTLGDTKLLLPTDYAQRSSAYGGPEGVTQFTTLTGDPYANVAFGASAPVTGLLNGFGPCAIMGRVLKSANRAIAILGDSNAAGNSYPAYDILGGRAGWIQHWLGESFPCVNLAVGGDVASNYGTDNFSIRSQLMRGIDTVLLAPGRNDIANGVSAAATMANLQAIAASLRVQGVRRVVLVVQVYPWVTTTDGYTTLANQTAVTTNNYHIESQAFLALARAAPAGFDLVIDCVQYVADATTPTKWKVNPSVVASGTATGGGSSSMNDSGASFPVTTPLGNYKGFIVRNTTDNTVGAIINHSATQLIIGSFNGSFSAGKAYQIVSGVYTPDGIHVSGEGTLDIEAGIGSAATLLAG